jgi:hypothetical protein
MASREIIRSMLAGGDRRSIGRSDEIAALVTLHPRQVAELVECLWDADPCIRMRAADAMEKASRESTALLQEHKAELLGLAAETGQQEMRWHLAVILPRLRLTAPEGRRVVKMFRIYLEGRSSIVKTFAMHGIADLALQDLAPRPMVTELIRSLARTGTPAMRARGRKILRQLEQPIHSHRSVTTGSTTVARRAGM